MRKRSLNSVILNELPGDHITDDPRRHRRWTDNAPATASIMSVVPLAKAGVGSAINDTTRLIGASLGVAIVGSVYASLYNSRLTQRLPASVPSAVARAIHGSVGAAIQIVKQADST